MFKINKTSIFFILCQLLKKIENRNKEVFSNISFRSKLGWRDNEKPKKKSVSCYYNHLTPNRNFAGFQFLFKMKGLNKQVKKYYSNIVNDNMWKIEEFCEINEFTKKFSFFIEKFIFFLNFSLNLFIEKKEILRNLR